MTLRGPSSFPAGFPCRRCGGMRVRVTETRSDPEHQLAPTVWRSRRCEDCGRASYTAEVEVEELEARRRLAELGLERYYLRTAGGEVTRSTTTR